MNDDRARIISMLKREYIFQGLTMGQIAEIASRFKRITLDRNTVIFSEGSPPDCFYFILDGKVRETRQIGNRQLLLDVLEPGNFFGEQSLIFNRPRSETTTTVERTTLVRLERDEFNAVLDDFPQIRMNLSATAESRSLARRIKFDWLGTDEVIYFLTRKHDFFLFTSLLIPIFISILSIPTLVYVLTQVPSPFVRNIFGLVGALMLIGGIAWGIWNWIDWGNDYYIVTNQRVVWLEKVIGLYDSRREAPLDTILAVNVTSSQIGRWLNYGNINVRTFTGGILMRNASQPHLFASFVEGYRRRAIEISKEEEAREMERALEQALQRSQQSINGNVPPPALPISTTPPLIPGKPSKPETRPLTFRQRIEDILRVRYEHNGVITYRKHWFLLVQKAWAPVLLLVALVAVAILLVWLHFAEGIPILAELPWFTLIVLSSVIIFLWFGYYYWDWINDIYRLTPEQIHDIERKPLGREVKKTANLDSILSIEHERENLLGILFNFGTVTINVGQTQFLFRGVFNPDQVHQDIADYREALNRRKRAAEAARERDRMVNWLVTFHNETEKLEELENNWDEDEFSG